MDDGLDHLEGWDQAKPRLANGGSITSSSGISSDASVGVDMRIENGFDHDAVVDQGRGMNTKLAIARNTTYAAAASVSQRVVEGSPGGEGRGEDSPPCVAPSHSRS